jgi:hypothetical protein
VSTTIRSDSPQVRPNQPSTTSDVGSTRATSAPQRINPDDLNIPADRRSPVATSLAPPRTPNVQLQGEAASGALSFGHQLSELGAAANSSEELLTRFLKLAVLAGTLDKVIEYLAGELGSTLMAGALKNAKESVFSEVANLRERADNLDQQAQAKAESAQASQNDGDKGGASGTNNQANAELAEAAALHAQADGLRDQAGEMEHGYMQGIAASGATRMGQRDITVDKRADDANRSAVGTLVNALMTKNERTDISAEAEANRGEVAKLVLDMVDKRAEAQRGALRYR